MIGNALRMDIEAYAGRIDHNVVFATTKAGNMTREMIARYVGGLHFLLTLTPIHLRKARERARSLGDTALAAHFEHKIEEEVGHDTWAENDLESLAAKRDRADVMLAAKAMAANTESLIDDHPALYLSYIAFVEYISVVLGPRWLALLEERCGIPRTSMTAVGNHIELDREHAEEGFSVVDDLVGDPKLLPAMRDALARTMACYDAYCAEAVGVTAESGEVKVVQQQPYVSAA